MVRRTQTFRSVALAAAFPVVVSVTGCTHAVNAGLRLLGLQRSGERPTAVTSTYEHAQTFTWDRYATGWPSSPARLLSANQGTMGSCFLVSPGLTRVLPIAGGAPAVDLQRIGPVTLGVAGDGTEMFADARSLNTLGLARTAMRTTARRGTEGGCGRSLFAFVSLGMGSSYEPVVVR